MRGHLQTRVYTRTFKPLFPLAFSVMRYTVVAVHPASGTQPGHPKRQWLAAHGRPPSKPARRGSSYPSRKPVFVKLGPHRARLPPQPYRRTWVARVADGKGGNWTKAIGTPTTSTRPTAASSRLLAGTGQGPGSRPREGWIGRSRRRPHPGPSNRPLRGRSADARRGYWQRRQGPGPPAPGLRQATRLAARIARSPGLAGRPRRKMAPASVNRTCTVLKAALNLAADHDERNDQSAGMG